MYYTQFLTIIGTLLAAIVWLHRRNSKDVRKIYERHRQEINELNKTWQWCFQRLDEKFEKIKKM